MIGLCIEGLGIELRAIACGARTSRGLTPPPKFIRFLLFCVEEYKYLLTCGSLHHRGTPT